MRFSPNPMKFGVLDAKWSSLILAKNSPPLKKSQRSHSQQNHKIGFLRFNLKSQRGRRWKLEGIVALPNHIVGAKVFEIPNLGFLGIDLGFIINLMTQRYMVSKYRKFGLSSGLHLVVIWHLVALMYTNYINQLGVNKGVVFFSCGRNRLPITNN